MLAVIGMLHDKDIGGTLACMESVVDSWYCAPLEGPRGATAEQLLEHLGKGAIYNSVAQAPQAAMADAKPEDTVLVCGSFHTVAHVMEVMDAGEPVASKFQNRLTGTIVLVALGVIILPGLLDGQKSITGMNLQPFRWCRSRAIATNRICCLRRPRRCLLSRRKGRLKCVPGMRPRRPSIRLVWRRITTSKSIRCR